ncbi:ABC transporter substrate-binding protein [Rubrimonas sp.]|uniref:ABC transporter substrate-binding protein n=1 Tax=Rubrimonas sp. TaxID=2036015 RepID=UPI002FDE2144
MSLNFPRIASALALSTALVAAPALAADLTVVSWGGAYTKSQVEAYHKPWMEMTGKTIISVDYDGSAAPIKAQVEAGNVTWDLIDIELSDAVRLCDEGLIEPLDHSMLPPAPDGTPATEDFIEGALNECSVASIVWAHVYAYDTTVFPEGPTTAADFFDLEKFPGKRGMRKIPKANLEFALMADGVPAAEVYDVLETEEGVARAFAKIESIKDSIVWWETGAQAPQLLADGEVVMTTAYNGRIFNAQVAENKPMQIVWDGQILDFDLWIIPKGAPNKENALEFIKFSTDTQRLADQAKWIAYGPARLSSAPMVGLYQDGVTEMGPHMPTNPANMSNAIVSGYEFWADNTDELNERFAAWLAQ